MPYVYLHKRKDNQVVFYVGVSYDDYNGTFKRAFNLKQRSWLWHEVYKDAGGCEVEITCKEMSIEDAKQKEAELIKKYGQLVKGGTLANLQKGNNGIFWNYKKIKTKKVALTFKVRPENLEEIRNKMRLLIKWDDDKLSKKKSLNK